MEVTVLVSNLVQVKQGLVDGFLEFESCLHGLHTTAPLILSGLLDVLKHNAAATVVLKLHKRLGVFHFLSRGLTEVLGKSRQSHVVTLKVEGLLERTKNPLKSPRPTPGQKTYHGEVGVHGVELQVDLLVDAFLGLGVVVLAYLTHLVAVFKDRGCSS